MKKLYVLLLSITSTTIITACNSGGSANGTNTSANQMNSHVYQIYVHGNGSESSVTSVQHIKLMPLNQEQIDKANNISLNNQSLLSTTSMPNSYNIGRGITGYPVNFYNNASISNLIPLNQLYFGACVTFSEVAALSYLNSNYSSTVDISPLDILDAGYSLYPNDMSSTGWDGLADASTLLNRLPNIGYYENYTATNTAYSNLSNEYENSGDTGDLTVKQLNQLSGFSAQLNSYNSLGGINGNFTYSFSNIASKWSTLFDTQGSGNSSLIKNALNNGQVVLLDFNVYDSSIRANSSACLSGNIQTVGTLDFTYNPNSGTFTQNSTGGAANNTWAYPTGCLAGGHQVWIIGYATASDGSTLFVIRNSWGNSGDQGQYYMTDSYLNNAATYAAAVNK